MDRFTTHKGFDIKCNVNNITLSCDNSSVSFPAGDKDKITDLLSMVSSMGPGAAALPYVSSSPYRVLMNDQGKTMTLISKGMTKGGLVFTSGTLDDLITAVHAGVDVYLDNERHRGGAKRPAATGFDVPEPPIDGHI